MDSIIFFILSWLSGWILIYSSLSLLKIGIISLIINYLIYIVYEIYLTSKYGGTLGKLLMKIKVVDSKGDLLSILDSTARYFSKWVSSLTLGIGYLMIIWDKKKQALHDKIAKTYVVDDSKSNLSKKIKTLSAVLCILIVFGYLVYNLSLAVMGAVVQIQSRDKELNLSSPVKSILDNCNSKLPYYSDICISSYSSFKNFAKINASSLIEICSKIRSKSFQSKCLGDVANIKKNESICTNSRSDYYQRICKKQYGLTKGIGNLLYPDKKLQFNETLNVSRATNGLRARWDCIETLEEEYVNEDVACFQFYSISGILPGKNNLSSYDADLKIWDENNDLLEEGKRLIRMYDVALKNNTIDVETLYSNLSILNSGKYTYEYIFYDVNHNKGVSINRTVKIVPIPKASLLVKDNLLGVEVETTCIQKRRDVFTNLDEICLYPYNVSEFKKGKDGLNLFEMSISVLDNNGNLIFQNEEVYGKDGHLALRNNILNYYADQSHGVRYDLKALPLGNYTIQVEVKDRLGKKKTTISRKLIVIESSPDSRLTEEGVYLGMYNGFNCIEKSDNIFTRSDSICLWPIVIGFDKTKEETVLFNMDQSIKDSQGNYVEQTKNNFGSIGQESDEPITNYYVFNSLRDLEPGNYVYEVTVYDKLGKKKITFNETFVITNEPPKVIKNNEDFFNNHPDAITDILEYRETKTYGLDNYFYEVTLSYVGNGEAQFIVNGETTRILKVGEQDALAGGADIKLGGVFLNTNANKNVEVFIGIRQE